jgi:integration host factor subunit beta
MSSEERITKTELIDMLARQAQLTVKRAETIAETIIETMIDGLSKDYRIEIRGFGTFVNRKYDSYRGRNPRTGKQVLVEPKKVPFFKASKELKNALKGE